MYVHAHVQTIPSLTVGTYIWKCMFLKSLQCMDWGACSNEGYDHLYTNVYFSN